MSHVPPTSARFLTRLSAGVLALATGVLVAAVPGTAQAAPDTSTSSAAPSESPASASPSASSTAPTSTTVSSTTSSSSASTSSTAPKTSAPQKGVEQFHSMMPSESPDARAPRVAAGAQAATSAASPMPLGVDVASWQHPNDLQGDINWAAVAASGQSFAVVKATEGDYYTNPYVTGDLNGAHAAGMVVGAYHFARPQISATAQADYFAAAIRGMPGPALPPVLDLEVTGGLGVTDLVNWTAAFLQRVQADTGMIPMIYTGPNFWKTSLGNSTAFGQYPLWEAHYTGAAAPDPIGAWGGNYTMWQYTSTASVPGIIGNVDQNRFNTSNGATPGNLHGPVGNLDFAGATPTGVLNLYGWAIDPDTPTTADTVHVYVDGVGQALTANNSRPDVGNAFPGAGANHGFSLTASVGPGQHTVCVYAIDTTDSNQHTGLGCPTVTVVPGLPWGSFDAATVNSTGVVTAAGWSFDPDTPGAANTVQMYVDGQWNQSLPADGSRPDVGSAFPAAGPNHGFGISTQLNPGTHSVCLFAIDSSFADRHSDLGCRTVTYVPNVPIGWLDSATVSGTGTLTVSGWDLDPDTLTTPGAVHLYVDGRWNQVITADGSRPDIGTAFPGAGAAHGFTASTQLDPGKHTVCLYAIDTTYGNWHSTLGCRSVQYVPTLPIGWWDTTTVSPTGTLTVGGWAFDPDTPTTAGQVHVYVDGVGQAVTANGSRPDIGAAFPAAGPAHGFTATASIGPGNHTVCVYAIDTTIGSTHSTLGCRTVTLVANVPLGVFEAATVAGDGTLTVAGWSFDPDTPTTADTVHLYVDGQWKQAITANESRPDVGSVFPAAGPSHGFSATTALTPGSHTVCLYAIDTSFGDRHSDLGCRTVTH